MPTASLLLNNIFFLLLNLPFVIILSDHDGIRLAYMLSCELAVNCNRCLFHFRFLCFFFIFYFGFLLSSMLLL